MEEKELLEIIEKAAKDGRKELDLSNKGIKSLPAEIGQLKNLRELYLFDNQLTSVPNELWQLIKLTVISLCRNQLTSVPKELEWLTNLERLPLHENQLMSVPKELGRLRNLEWLSLDGNRLTSVPKELGHLTNLKNLYLNKNQLTSVPKELGQLKNLEKLSLSENKLTNVPKELGRLTNLERLYLDGNPLESPPPEVVKQGTKAILAYLRELEKGEKERYEAKLLILGDGSEGKTCVSRALRGLPFKKNIRTEGVEVVQWKFENKKFAGDKEKEIRLNIWDFEGQEINHQSHQFFLTGKSLYILVINGRRRFKPERAEYWLDTIRARAPESRVILVASECENTTPSWPLDKLKQEYGDLLQGERWYFAVGCETKKGIDDLSDEIKGAAANMEQMGRGWPETYQNAEKAIEEMREEDARVSRDKLYEIFEKSGIDKDGFENAAEQMETLGLITQFRESLELGDFVVLNPQWLTKGISLVMEDKKLDKDKGEITQERMKEIWDEGYGGLYPTLHSCMKEFELLYDMEDMPGCLVPLRFGDVRPEIPWSEIPGAKERRIEYKLNIHPPKGIMSRFIVKTHHMIAKTEQLPKGIYWDKGVFLRTGEGAYRSEALCEFIEEDRTIRINVRAAFPQNMVEQLHGFARAVFNFFEGMEPERSYGCMKFEEDKEDECEGTHAERRILFALSRSKEIDCEKGWHVVDPKRLVFGFSSFGERVVKMKELKEALDKKPKWAKGLAGDVMSSLVWIDKVYNEVVGIRREQKELPAKFRQEVDLKLRDHIRLINEMLDNREFNSAPAVVSIEAVDGSKFNPRSWFEKDYVLRPFCEWEGGAHPIDFSVPFKMTKEWWVKTAPKLSLAVKVLSAGVQMACAGLPLLVKPEIFEAVEKHVDFMKELAGHLELEGGAESDISAEAGQTVEKMKGKDRLRDLRQFGGEDEKRVVRMQLAELFSEIAPKNYKARQWGELRRIKMPDNTYRWLCEEHAEKYRK
jgi:internalin A